MGQKPTKVTKQWADTPFAMLETPRKKRGITNPSKASGAVNSATDMCLIHNVFTRTINSIYLQAPNIKLDKDIADFITYMESFCIMLHDHHDNEERFYFPWLEEYIGIKNYMEKNVEQHHAFAPGLKQWEDYIAALKAGKETFDGAKIRSIIDGFGPIFFQHLKEEVESFVALETFGDKIDWVKWNKRVSDFALKAAEMDHEIPMMVTNMDISFEEPIHASTWPPFPWIAGVIFRLFYIPKYKGAWRFSSCDTHGMPKDLEFV